MVSYDELLEKLAEMDSDDVEAERWRLHTEIGKVKEVLRVLYDGLAQLAGVQQVPESLWSSADKSGLHKARNAGKKQDVTPDRRVFDSEYLMQLVHEQKRERSKKGTPGAICNWDKQSLSVLRAMSVKDVAEWIGAKANLEGGAIWSAVFMKHHITGWVLPHLSEHDLKYELGMTRIDTRKRFQLAVEELRKVCEFVAQEEVDAVVTGRKEATTDDPEDGGHNLELAQSIILEAGLHTVQVDNEWGGADSQELDNGVRFEADDEWS